MDGVTKVKEKEKDNESGKSHNTPPPPLDPHSNPPPPGDWTPYNNRPEFELADLLFTHQQMSIKGITQETLDPISIENNRIFPGEVNLNLTLVLCTIQK